ncbi:diguanylate cyclase (GGDEF)-like protein [Actinomycetospora succinea]|uniref:Diguanylate cyclase (GGDEF)-like protein n=1 Tax=Actinomycetospora succinea TaxID=663603 RepID=A0A4R6UQ03_9PSEU|nr:GGDEF domain-containing protein [Actinomycetospora succinea]TDQ49002.1 diguanylate cyclase (GGDEF)-like protein [Actinomycetospora succinea]
MPADHGPDGTTTIHAVAPAAHARAEARAALLDRTRNAVLTATLVPSPDPRGSAAALDAVLGAPAARTAEPGLRALLLRQSLVARVLLAAEPAVSPGTCTRDTETEAQLDELLELVAAHGLSLFGADAQMLRARRALLVDDEESALSAVATGLAHLEEPVLVDHSPTVAEHRHNVACSRRLAASTLVSLGLHDLADTLVEHPGEDGTGGYERVRLGVSWGVRLERAGRPGGERLGDAVALASAIGPRAAGVQRPLLAAAGVLACPDRGPAPTAEERRIARRGAAALAAGHVVPSQHDRLIVELARARALERAGDHDAAVAVLATRRTRPPRGEASLMLAVTRELARLRTRIATAGGPRQAAESALGDYVADLEAELWTLHRARALSLRTGLAHDRLRREHGQVTALALADPLTGLPNRRALDQHLEEVLAGTASAAVAMIDVDRFKQINDTVSHARGDEVLRGVATALRSSLRAPDLVARYGGDEFVVVLPETAVGDAAAALGRARSAVAGLPAARGCPVTLSVGVVAARSGEGPADVLARADAAMYAAKRAGGDAVRTHDGPATGAFAANRT